MMARLGQLLFRQNVARVIALLCGAYTVYYLYWRLTETLNPDAMIFSVALFGAEVFGFLSFAAYALMTWDVNVKPRSWLGGGLKVDVFLPTYNEDVDILEATLTGCNAIRYPHATYVLDDGRRPAVEALARRMGCGYLTRSDNKHAKAGNINAALPRTRGDFIVVLDADTVPQPDFLDNTLGYFVDAKVALVQLPQEFYNVDSMQHPAARRPEDWHEQSLFYRIIQPGKNRWNAAFWCGSPSVLRRAALLDVGGVATDSITEDIHTCMRLHARGWKTVYHNEALAFGIAPETVQAFGIQRLRWAQGAMQILRRGEAWRVLMKLKWSQRFNYLGSMLTYFESYQKLAFLVIPSVILVSGLLPISADGGTYFARWSTYFLLGILANTALGRGEYNYLRVETYNLLKMFTFIWASTVLMFPRRLGFKVTPKGRDTSRVRREWRAVVLHLATLSILVLTLTIGGANLVWQVTASFSRPDVAAVAMVWACINVLLVSLAVITAIRRVHRREAYRFPARFSACVVGPSGVSIPATTRDVSQYGLGLEMHCSSQDCGQHDLRAGQEVSVALSLGDDRLVLPSRVVRFSTGDRGVTLACRFEPLTTVDRRALLELLFIRLPREQQGEQEQRRWCEERAVAAA